MTKKRRAQVRDALLPYWKIDYEKFNADEGSENFDYESLCIGWCVAKGYTTEEGYYFFQDMVEAGIY